MINATKKLNSGKQQHQPTITTYNVTNRRCLFKFILNDTPSIEGINAIKPPNSSSFCIINASRKETKNDKEEDVLQKSMVKGVPYYSCKQQQICILLRTM